MTNSLSDRELVDRFRNIRVTVVNGRRSPHKPILLLWAIGRYLSGENRMTRFSEAEEQLNSLIRRFGPPRGRGNVDLPFWHLRNDGLWEIDRPDLVRVTSAQHAYISDLKAFNIRGGIVGNILDRFDANPDLVRRIVQGLLNRFFPPSFHSDLLRELRLTYVT